MAFTHLHCHSSYSDGLAHPLDLIRQAQALGFTALALTDHNTLDGHAAFVSAAQYYPVIPLLGAELRVHTEQGHGHNVILSRNEEEYRKLQWLLRRHKPIRLGDVKSCGIVTSGCLGGVVARLLAAGDYWSASDALREYRDKLGDDFYIEVQPNFGPVMPWLFTLARELSVPAVATNDVHYLYPHDSQRHTNPGLYMRSQEEMQALCSSLDFTYAVENTAHIAQACNWTRPGYSC